MDALPGLGAGWWLQNDGQGDELESDSIGVHLSHDLHINPKGLPSIFKRA